MSVHRDMTPSAISQTQRLAGKKSEEIRFVNPLFSRCLNVILEALAHFVDQCMFQCQLWWHGRRFQLLGKWAKDSNVSWQYRAIRRKIARDIIEVAVKKQPRLDIDIKNYGVNCYKEQEVINLGEICANEICRMGHLLHLRIIDARLTDVDVTHIGQLKKLKTLVFHNTRMKVLSKELAQLSDLEEMTLTDTWIQSVDDDFKLLKKLKKLNIPNQCLTGFVPRGLRLLPRGCYVNLGIYPGGRDPLAESVKGLRRGPDFHYEIYRPQEQPVRQEIDIGEIPMD